MVHSLLEGATAYVGFDVQKESIANYFLCDGTADDVQIQEAIDYVNTLGGGSMFLEGGTYDITATLIITQRGTMVIGVGSHINEANCTRLVLANNSDCTMIQVRAARVTLEHMVLDGNKANQGAGNWDGVHVQAAVDAFDFRATDIYCQDIKRHGWLLGGSIAWLYDCLSEFCDGDGVNMTGGRNIIIGFYSFGNALDGYNIGSNYNQLIGCYSVEEEHNAIQANGSRNIISDCIILDPSQGVDNTYRGIRFWGGEFNIISSNSIYSSTATNPKYSIDLEATSNTIVSNNNLEGAETTELYLSGDSDNNIIENNIIETTSTYHIDISAAACNGNRVVGNELLGAGTKINDAGTDTKLVSKSFQFTEPVVGAISVTSPTGVDVDATTEGALAWGQLPTEVQQVVRLKIWAVATDAPIGTPGQMHLEVIFNAGASNAAYNEAGKSWTLANHDGEETDYVANDVVHWVIEDGDVGNELLNLVAEDSFEIFAMWEVGDDPDGATDAVFRVVEVEYV